MKNLILPIYISVICITALLACMVGYHVGKSEVMSDLSLAQTPVTPTTKDAGLSQGQGSVQAENQQPAAQPTKQISPEALAEEQGIPASVTNTGGDYTLVSVVEGADLNQQLSENLQLVTMQRQQLGVLSQQFDNAPAEAVQQRELIAGQINEARNALNQNLQYMARGYGYTLSNTYLRVPYHVSLLLEEKVGEKVESKLIHEFKTSEEYHSFQNSNNSYVQLKQQVALLTKSVDENSKEMAAAVTAEDASDSLESPPKSESVSTDTDAETQAELGEINAMLKDLRESLMEMYGYDPEKEYKLIFIKSALYARPA